MIYDLSIFHSDYPFLIHRLPQKDNLPQVKKHWSTLLFVLCLSKIDEGIFIVENLPNVIIKE